MGARSPAGAQDDVEYPLAVGVAGPTPGDVLVRADQEQRRAVLVRQGLPVRSTTVNGTPRARAGRSRTAGSAAADRRSRVRPSPRVSNRERPSRSQACGRRKPGRAEAW
nr:hypothetical protein GCM10020093_034840 [Planobispora longispora]